MTSGKIQYAETHGAFILKFIGDVRLTLSSALDKKLESIIQQPDITSVVIDLTETQGIDSTSLGLLARLSIQSSARLGFVPTIHSTNEDINRILITMGFDQVFIIVHEVGDSRKPVILHDLPCSEENSDQEIMGKVITAHKTLMDMNERNRQEFQDLVQQLERDKTTG